MQQVDVVLDGLLCAALSGTVCQCVIGHQNDLVFTDEGFGCVMSGVTRCAGCSVPPPHSDLKRSCV